MEDRGREGVSEPSSHSCSGADRGDGDYYYLSANSALDMAPLRPIMAWVQKLVMDCL